MHNVRLGVTVLMNLRLQELLRAEMEAIRSGSEHADRFVFTYICSFSDK